jgi:hypothetical protein
MYVAPFSVWIVAFVSVFVAMYVFGKLAGWYVGFKSDSISSDIPAAIISVASVCMIKGMGSFNFGWVLTVQEYQDRIVLKKYWFCGGGQLEVPRECICKAEVHNKVTSFVIPTCKVVFSGRTKAFIDPILHKWHLTD